MPGALPARTLLMKSRTSFSFIPLSSSITVESWGFGKSLRGGIGILFKSPECVILKWFSSSSFGTSSFPLFDSTEIFLWEHKDFSRMISELDAFSFDVFYYFQLWRSPESFFEYDLRYSEVPPSHELGLLLISASAFSVLILTFPSVSVIYSIVFLRFYLFYALLHLTTPDKRHI